MIRPWTPVKSRIEIQNRIFSIKTETSRSPRTGKDHDFFIISAGPWVNVIPLTESGQVILVRQYRHGTREITLEIPGGLVEDGQTPAEAARRELIEETGYDCSELIPLGRVRPNPAILDNWCYSFLAKGLIKTGELHLDETEDLETTTIDLSRINEHIAAGDIDHSLVISAFYLYQSRQFQT